MAKKKNNILADFVDNFKKALNSHQQTQPQQRQTTQQLPTKSAWQQAHQKREAVANSILSSNRTNMMATATTAERFKNKGSFLNGLNLPTRETSQRETLSNGIQRAVDIRNKTPQEERKKEEEEIRKQEQLKQQQNNNGDYQIGGTFRNVVNQASKEEKKEINTENPIKNKEIKLPQTYEQKIFSKENLQDAEYDIEKRFLNTMENVTNATENTLLGAGKGLKDAADFTIHLANYPYDKARQLGFNIGSKLSGKTYKDDGDYSQLGIIDKAIPEDSKFRPAVNKLVETKSNILGKINKKSTDIDTYLDTNIAQNIEETNDPIAKKITEIAPSIGQQLPATVLGPEYFFLSSGGSYYKDALTRGMNKDQATVFGVVMGTVEGLTEKIQFGKLANTGKNIMSGGTIKQAFKDYGLNVADNMVQEGITEPITELAAQTIGGKDKADWNNIGKRMWEAAVDGGISSVIMDAGFSGVSSANRIIEKMENNEKISNEELKETLQDIQASGKVDINQSLQNSFNKVTNSIRDALYSKGINSTSALDKARNIDEAYKTNLTSEIQKALNDGKLNRDTYSELNRQLDQITQLKNSEELLNRAKDLDDTLELTDTDNSLSNVVEKLTSEAKLDNETYDKLKGIFDNIDNNMPYVAETSDNKKIDVFREDMMNFMNNSERAHNFAKSVESIIEKTGLNIRLNNELASDENGRIFNQNGETIIEINPNSESSGEFILMHELTHAIGNQDLKQTILDYANKNKEFETALKDFEARYGQTDITEEVMADISGQLLGNEEFINSLAQEQPSKFKQIYNAVKSWVKKFTGTYGYEDFVRDVETKWRKAYEQNKNNIAENIGNKTSHSFAGEKAQNHDINTLEKAKELEKSGLSNEDIYKQTGWYKGNEGKWRFELDDYNWNLKDIKNMDLNKMYLLEDILDAPELFEAYPEIKNIPVIFDRNLKSGTRGQLEDAFPNGRINDSVLRFTIKLNPEYITKADVKSYEMLGLKNQSDIYSTLQHEIQHWIQYKEDFSKGTNPQEAFYEINKKEQEKFLDILGTKNELYQKYDFDTANDIRFYLRQYLNNTIRINELQNSIIESQDKLLGAMDTEKQNMYQENIFNSQKFIRQTEQWQKEKAEKLENIVGKEGLKKVEKANEKYLDFLYFKEQKAFNAYKNTAGEQEARDVQDRIKLKPEEKKVTLPFIKNENTVYADNAATNANINSQNAEKVNIKQEYNSIEDVPQFEKSKNNYRPTPRKGWDMERIQKQLKTEHSDRASTREFNKFDSIDELMDNIYYHGSISAHDHLKAGSTLKEEQRTGGYGEEYHSISLSKNKNIASNFASMGSEGTVMPVLLKKDSNVISMPNIEDSIELEEILPELWNKNVDAVKIGDWDIDTKGYGEQEIVILNPNCIATLPYDTTYFKNFGKPKFENMTKEDISNSYNKYVDRAIKDLEYKIENAKETDINTSFLYKTEEALNNHIHNLENQIQQYKDLYNKFSENQQIQTDNQGRTLTKEQQEYFKDSKVRDKNGNLLEVYHGTNNDFNEFDSTKFGKYTGKLKGIWLTDKIINANAYGNNIIQSYVNITNPGSATEVTMNKDQYSELLRNAEVKDTNIDSSWEYFKDKNDFDILTHIQRLYENKGKTLQNFYDDVINTTGIDGIYDEKYLTDGSPVWIAFNSNQVKKISNTNPTSNPDIRYSKGPAKVTNNQGKTLLAEHNLTEDKLKSILDLGGFPVPSIAITNPDLVDHNGFGDISIIFDKNTIDPSANEANKVYSRDAYTTRVPAVVNKINEKGLKEVSKNTGLEEWYLKENYKEISIEEAINKLKRNEQILDKYLKGKGIKVNPVYRDFKGFTNLKQSTLQDFINNHKDLVDQSVTDKYTYSTYEKYYKDVHDLFVKELMKEAKIPKEKAESLYKDYPGYNHWNYFIKDLDTVQKLDGKQQLDEYATQTAKEKAANIESNEYKNFVKDLISPMYDGKYIRNNKDYYTKSGTPRSFNQRYEEYTLDNIVKIMNENKGTGQESNWGVGINEIAGDASKRFKSIEDIKNSENRISSIDEEEHKQILNKYSTEFRELESSILDKYSDSNIDEYVWREKAIEDAMKSIARKMSGGKNSSISNVINQFEKNGIKINEEQAQRTINLIKNLSTLPTRYFEAKPQRAVGFDEVKAIVIPNDISPDLKQQLIDKGMNVIEYDKNIEGDRQSKIRELDSYKFSKQSDKWQEWLEKNFPSRGTTTKFSDILLPNANIQNNNSTLNNVKTTSDSVINKIEQGLKDIYPVELDNEQLKDIATNIANNPTEKGILEALKDYRTAYLEDETADNEIINEIKSTVRNTKLDVSNLKNSITDYNDLRKANFGKLKLGNDGSKIDTFYQELSSTYPDYFDSEISNEADQLDAIIDFINEDQTTKTEYQMTDEDIINSGLIDAVTTALNTDEAPKEIIKETPKETVKETTENDLIKRNKELYKQRYNLEKEAQRLDRKIELTDNEKGIVKSLLNGDITIDEIPTRYAEHKDSIIQKYQNDKALNEVRSEIKKNKEQSKSVYNTTADEVVKNLSKFKDKSKGILYRRETAIRNIQDVVKDKVLADKINNTYFKPVLENEAARTRYINDNMQKINDLKIDTKKTYPYNNPMVDKNGKKYMENLKINEADVAGLYLEKKISDDYLTKNHIDKARIEKIADTFKSILDDGINNMETEVMKAGYAPIGRIENYFPHFMETRPDGLIGKISNFIGIRTKVKSLPTEIAGKTDTFRPGKTWNQNALHREGDITDINALKAMENYINGASDVIYHTDDIQKLRALERSIRESYSDEATKKTINNILKDSELTFDEKEEAIYNKLQNVKTEIPNFVTWLTEYTNILANKKSQSDRSMEYNWGRQTYTTMQDIESKIASNMIGGNLSVSLTNFAPLSQAMGTTKIGNVLIGMLETTQNTIKNVFGNGDNFVDSSDFLTRRRGTETIHKLKASEKVSKVLGKPMEIIDNFTSEAIVRAKYRENVQNGMTEMEALKNADEYTANLMADRSKGALPTLFNSKNPLSKLVTMFQVEPNNMLSNYTKDWRNYTGNKAVAIAKLTVASYAFNTILKSLRGGSDILPDPINIVSQLIKMMTSDDEEEKKKAQDELISSITGSIPFGTSAVVLGQALGIDMPDSVQNSGRMPIASAIPNWKNIVSGAKSDSPEYRNQQFYKEFMKPLLYLGLPTGGAQINKTIEGLKAYEKGGSYKYNSKGEKLLQFPVKQNMTNLIKSATFGKYSTPEGQEYATNFDAFNAKQTKLYDETDIDYKDLKKYYKDTKGQKDLAKMQYVDDMNISDDDKVELYKSDILSEKQAENLDYALDHKITTKKTFDNEYQKLQEKNISLPTKEDYQMMNSADISLKNYSDYKVATKGLKTEAEKNKALRNLSCSSKTKQAIYENTTGKDDETYQSVKNVISINNYLDYKSQKFVADKDENGKAISGSRKQKLVDYLNSNRNMNYQEKLIVLGMNNKLSSGELTVVFNYVNSQKLTAKQKIAILKKVKGFKINGNNISW